VRVGLRLPGTVWAGETCLVGMGHEVIVEAVLSGEGGLTDPTFKRSQTRVAPEGKWRFTFCALSSVSDPDSHSIRSVDPDPFSESGSGSRRTKI
jgi:hypothetical protein